GGHVRGLIVARWRCELMDACLRSLQSTTAFVALDGLQAFEEVEFFLGADEFHSGPHHLLATHFFILLNLALSTSNLLPERDEVLVLIIPIDLLHTLKV